MHHKSRRNGLSVYGTSQYVTVRVRHKFDRERAIERLILAIKKTKLNIQMEGQLPYT